MDAILQKMRDLIASKNANKAAANANAKAAANKARANANAKARANANAKAATDNAKRRALSTLNKLQNRVGNIGRPRANAVPQRPPAAVNLMAAKAALKTPGNLSANRMARIQNAARNAAGANANIAAKIRARVASPNWKNPNNTRQTALATAQAGKNLAQKRNENAAQAASNQRMAALKARGLA
jgi:colicin import membrane protein